MAPSRVALFGCGVGAGLCAGSAVGALEGLYVLSLLRPTEYGALVYGYVLYGLVGAALGAALGLPLAVLGPVVRVATARAWSGAFAAVGAALGVVVGGARVAALLGGVVSDDPEIPLAIGFGALALVAAWFGGHLLAKTPLRALVSARGTAAAWVLGLLVAGLLSVSPAPGGAGTFVPGRPQAESFASKPDVVLILVGGLAADAVGVYGAPEGATPRLDAFAGDAVVFEQAIAPAVTSGPAVASVYTALPASRTGVAFDGAVLADGLPTLAEVLRDGGYATAGLPNSSYVSGARGFDRGFDWYPFTLADPLYASESAAALVLYARLREVWLARVEAPPIDAWYTPADAQLAQASAWLTANAAERGFLFVHLLEPERPWFAHPWTGEAAGRGAGAVAPERARSLYAGEVLHVDAAIGAFLDTLRAAGRYDDALVVITADHGRTGAGRLDDGAVHVPLLVKLPRGERAGTRVSWQVRIVDVAPTLVERAGFLAPPTWWGVNLFDDWFDDDLALTRPPEEPDPDAPPFVAPTWADHPGSRPALTQAVVNGGWTIAVRAAGRKVVRSGGRGLAPRLCFDLVRDPEERQDVSDREEEECRGADLGDALLGGWTGVRPPKDASTPG